MERLVKEHGRIRILVEMRDFHGWTAGALWQDIKFDAKHFKDIDRVAMVGETKWQHGMAVFCKPFTTASIRYFDHAAIDQARVARLCLSHRPFLEAAERGLNSEVRPRTTSSPPHVKTSTFPSPRQYELSILTPPARQPLPSVLL